MISRVNIYEYICILFAYFIYTKFLYKCRKNQLDRLRIVHVEITGVFFFRGPRTC
ncbi:hypothetical protein DICVIV_00348 [Dictyocaulus viviparus]|uniref:Uncharacterized protein n=1 Tax=Dictyocaulus viviparus TaxID=29172 RepID=A0A0D8Y9J6_DICVI|nr:hypothetical protein DICVIV_00348 [Dictyocaulus viviparus]